MKVITLDYKEFSEEALKEFKEALEEHNLYLGDLIEDCHGENNSDTYVLYINNEKLKPDEIKDQFPMIGDIEEDECP